VSIRGPSNLSAQRPHNLYLLLRKSLGNEQSYSVTAIDADQRQSDAGVSSRGFDDHASGSERPFPLGPADNTDRRPVFHAAARVQVLELGKHVSPGPRRQAVEPEDWRFSDQFGDVIGDAETGARIGRHPTGYGSSAECVNSCAAQGAGSSCYNRNTGLDWRLVGPLLTLLLCSFVYR